MLRRPIRALFPPNPTGPRDAPDATPIPTGARHASNGTPTRGAPTTIGADPTTPYGRALCPPFASPAPPRALCPPTPTPNTAPDGTPNPTGFPRAPNGTPT